MGFDNIKVKDRSKIYKFTELNDPVNFSAPLPKPLFQCKNDEEALKAQRIFHDIQQEAYAAGWKACQEAAAKEIESWDTWLYGKPGESTLITMANKIRSLPLPEVGK